MLNNNLKGLLFQEYTLLTSVHPTSGHRSFDEF